MQKYKNQKKKKYVRRKTAKEKKTGFHDISSI